MDSHQISLVKSSWKIFQAINPVIVGDVFYTKLFMMAPRLRHLFGQPKEEQSKKLIDMLSIVVARLDRLDELSEDIRQLALRHAGYGVKADHYAIVGSALLWTLETGLGNEWTGEIKDAWEACYTMLAETMIMTATTRSKSS
jgi:hemoglobin-like flavoprotein